MNRKLFISHALIWAALMIANGLLATDLDKAATFQLLLTVGWYFSDSLLRKLTKSPSSSGCCG